MISSVEMVVVVVVSLCVLQKKDLARIIKFIHNIKAEYNDIKAKIFGTNDNMNRSKKVLYQINDNENDTKQSDND